MAHLRLRSVAVRKSAVRFVLALGALLVLNQTYGMRLTETLLPALRWEIAQLDDNFRVLDLTLSRQGADTVVRLDAGLAQVVLLGGRALLTDQRARANVSTLAGSIMQPAILALAWIVAWPSRRAAIEYPVRLSIACACIALVLVADVPFVLWGELWDIQISALEPERFSPLLMWKNFLQGGGRFVLGLGAGMLAVGVGHWLSGRYRSALIHS